MNPPAAKPFVTECQRVLHEARLTQRWLAEATGINEALISQYVNGRLRPRELNRSKIAEALGRNDPDGLFAAPTVR